MLRVKDDYAFHKQFVQYLYQDARIPEDISQSFRPRQSVSLVSTKWQLSELFKKAGHWMLFFFLALTNFFAYPFLFFLSYLLHEQKDTSFRIPRQKVTNKTVCLNKI
jgi:hypothetical protein